MRLVSDVARLTRDDSLSCLHGEHEMVSRLPASSVGDKSDALVLLYLLAPRAPPTTDTVQEKL